MKREVSRVAIADAGGFLHETSVKHLRYPN